MAFLTAERIHNGTNWLPGGTVIEVADNGQISALHSAGTVDNVTFYDGVLAPGFVNAHCHIELSHMKGVVPEHTGLIPFLQQVTFHRNDFTDEQKKVARNEAYLELLHNGIVAVGDIANTTDTLDVRAMDKLHIHSFIEAIGFTEEQAQQRFDNTANIYNAFADQELKKISLHQSIIPHAPYSVSPALFKLIDEYNPTSLISIHNQESEAEDQYYFNKEGAVNDLLKGFGINDSFFQPSGKTSLQTYLDHFSLTHPIIFVHNTCTTAKDIAYAMAGERETYWCLCPKANLYIENKLPNISLFDGLNICIGTDSLASNHQLSILAELQTLKNHFSHLNWETLIRWATRNGAHALQMQDRMGSLTPGTAPGVIQMVDLDNNAVVKRIV